jgi:Ser/Thr protein kinase RdoA (MazF antagonist)
MDKRALTISDLLTRVRLHVPLERACGYVMTLYGLGNVTAVVPFYVGHMELNVTVTTETGVYVIKFFNKDKGQLICRRIADGLVNLYDQGISVPRVRLHDGQSMFTIPSPIGEGYLTVTEYFDGQSFNDCLPNENDVVAVAKELAHINSLYMDVDAPYDPWILPYLGSEYREKSVILTPEEQKILEPSIREFESLDISRFSKNVVHYDLHRDNVKKSQNGTYCLFDLESVGMGYPIMDVATYLGLNVYDSRRSDEINQSIGRKVFDAYTSVRPLTSYEISSLPALIRGIWAINLLEAAYLIRHDGDDTAETYKWYDLGVTMLKRSGMEDALLTQTLPSSLS